MNQITLDEIDRYIKENEQDESAFLRSAASYEQDVVDFFYNPNVRVGDALPWSSCEGKFELRRAEVTLWLGFNGHGKSLILGQVTNRLLELGKKVSVASFEMRPVATLARMCKQASGCRQPTLQYIGKYHKWSDSKLYIYDQHGSTPPEHAINYVRYAASIGCSHVIIDSLMKVIESEDDYNGQKRFVNQLCVVARDTGVHIHLVHHSRKGQDESKAPGKMDAKGSGAITDLVDNCVTSFRVKAKKGADDPDAFLMVDKQRHGEWEGGVPLWFHEESQSFCGTSRRQLQPIVFERQGEPF